MIDEKRIKQLVKSELASIDDPTRRATLESALVTPIALNLKWGFGKPGETFPCWLVGISASGEERLVYCDQDFGPNDPWGFVGTDEDWMGMDCQWYVGLEHVAICIGILSAPPGYEVP